MSRSLLLPFSVGLAGLAGLAAGWILASRFIAAPGPAFMPLEGAEDSPVLTSPTAASGPITLDDLRRVVREELAAAARTPGAQVRTEAEDVPDDAVRPTPEQDAALSRINQLLDAAISRRNWTEADVDAMRAEFPQLTADQQAEVMRRYAMAVNQGRIVPQSDRLPF
jgi:hypothetical protein